MDAIECFENDQLFKYFTRGIRFAQTSKNPAKRARAEVWRQRIKALYEQDRAAVKAARAARKSDLRKTTTGKVVRKD